ncbi:MAG: AEC family transporter, partial [Erysipelotrichaceae bacterium]|nr:AEC family transporter [Erysipelotrichaceae bacterium]
DLIFSCPLVLVHNHSSLIAIILFFTHIQLPECISGSLSFIGSVVTPLSMISIGVSIACYPIKEVITNKTLYFMSALRLVLIPVITYFMMHLFVNDPMIVQMVTITLGMPVGSMVAMGASEYHGDVKTASFGVALSTLLSLMTIPILLLLLA